MRTEDVTEESVRTLARRLLDEPRFQVASAAMQLAQREAGGYARAVDELEQYLHRIGGTAPRAWSRGR